MSVVAYVGFRKEGLCVVRRVERRGERVIRTIDLPARHDLWNHSPDGFEWGYGGSGPAQLALAILADHLKDDERAVRLHQAFKFKVVAGLQGDSWELPAEDVERVVRDL